VYALFATWTLDPTRDAASSRQRQLEEQLVPLVRHQPGFVGGTWCAGIDEARGYSYLLWTTEKAARGFGDYVRTSLSARVVGARLESLLVAHVLVAMEA
jgi:hypothetical protein